MCESSALSVDLALSAIFRVVVSCVVILVVVVAGG